MQQVRHVEQVARALEIDTLKVIDLDGISCYDIKDYLEAHNAWHDLPSVKVKGVTRSGTDATDENKTKQLRWLIKGVPPRDKYSFLDGRSGTGKSTMPLWIAARSSDNRVLFSTDRDPTKNGFKTLIHTTQYDCAYTIAVRLKLMGAEFKNIGRLRLLPLDRQYPFDWTRTEEVQALNAHLQETQYDLLMIDPVMDLIGTSNNNDLAAIKRVIGFTLAPILETGCAVLCVHHERKDVTRNEQLVDRALGSQAWTAAARTVLHMQAVQKRKKRKFVKM